MVMAGIILPPMKTHFEVLVIGGGNAGISAAAHLLLKRPGTDVAIVEPSEKHYYQPAWTLVGAGVFDAQDTVKPEANFIPKKATWLKTRAASFEPDKNTVVTEDGTRYTYNYLIVCPGIQLNWSDIKGLPEALGKNGVTSNYLFDLAPYTWKTLQSIKSGRMIFHAPNSPIKCGGAPMKIMYLAADYIRKHNLQDQVSIEFWSGGTRVFGVRKFEMALEKIIKRYGIKLHFFQSLVEVDGENKRARFIGIGEDNKDVETWVDFAMIHVVPPQSAPNFIKTSPLANEAGWVDVDKYTLQHVRYPNVFSLGDASSLPTARTGAAIRKQVPVVVNNLISVMNGQSLERKYNGYSSCPIVSGYGKLVLAEFDYDNNPMETFPFNQAKERWSMYQLKKQVLPRLYWHAILKGRMQG